MLSEIIHGNNLEVLPTLDVDWSKVVLVSDPPYNVRYTYNEYYDKMKEKDYFDFLKNVFYREYNGNIIPHVILHYPEALHRYSIETGIPPVKEITWVFNNHLPKQHRSICYYGIKPNLRQVAGEYKNPNDRRIKGMIAQGKFPPMYDWIECQQVKNMSKEKVDHPCQIPIALMEKIIGVLPKDSIIIDPFAGSGSTGVACANLEMDFIGIELDEHYCEVARKRLESLKKIEDEVVGEIPGMGIIRKTKECGMEPVWVPIELVPPITKTILQPNHFANTVKHR